MKFLTAYSTNRKSCPSGSRFRKTFVRDSEGNLIESGKIDLFDSVQKASQGNVIEDLIRRASNGDDTAIREPIDSFVDVSGAPRDLLEAHNMLYDARSKFNSLPAELRSKFGNNFSTFLSSLGDGSYVSLLQMSNKSNIEIPKTEHVDSLTSEELNKVRNLIGGNSNA